MSPSSINVLSSPAASGTGCYGLLEMEHVLRTKGFALRVTLCHWQLGDTEPVPVLRARQVLS